MGKVIPIRTATTHGLCGAARPETPTGRAATIDALHRIHASDPQAEWQGFLASEMDRLAGLQRMRESMAADFVPEDPGHDAARDDHDRRMIRAATIAAACMAAGGWIIGIAGILPN